MNKKLVTLVSSAMVLLPVIALADINPGPAPVGNPSINVVNVVNAILNFIWPLFIGFAVIMLLVAGFMFLTARGEAEQVATARNAVIWGMVGIVVGILAFSIPFIIRNTLGF